MLFDIFGDELLSLFLVLLPRRRLIIYPVALSSQVCTSDTMVTVLTIIAEKKITAAMAIFAPITKHESF